MSSTSAVACREIFDENSQPSAEEVSDYAHQIGIDVESESHLLPLAKDGLMQALPAPWKAYFDEKLQTHYYYNEDSKQTQWEHPLDQVYRDLVRRARDEDTCASVQELLTSEENTKNVEKYEVKVDSEDEELSTDSENASDIKESSGIRRPLSGRPPLAPITRNEKKLSDIRISPLRRSIDSSLSIKPSGMPEFKRPFDRPKLFKQQSEIIDLKMHVLSKPDEDNFSSFVNAKSEKGFALTGKGSIFLKTKKPDLPSPDTEKSITLEGVTKSDPPKGILREKPDLVQKRVEVLGRPKLAASFEEDRKSVRFNLENSNVENTVSPSSNSSSSQNDGQSVISSPPVVPSQMSSPNLPLSPLVFSSPNLSLNLTPLNPPLTLAPLIARPPLPPRPQTSVENILSPRENSLKSTSGSDRESIDSDKDKGSSPRRRVVRPPAGDYIKAELFQKNFQKISDLVRPGDLETSPMHSLHVDDIVKKENRPRVDHHVGFMDLETSPMHSLHVDDIVKKENRPRSPMIPQMKNKISINLMESIDSETSIDSPDKEFANLDLNDLDDFKDFEVKENIENNKNESNVDNNNAQNLKTINSIYVPQIKIPKLELLKAKNYNSDDDKVSIASKELSESKTNSKSESLDLGKEHSNQTRVLISPQLKITPSLSISSHSDIKSTRNEIQSDRSWSSHFKPIASIIKPAQIKSPDSNTNLNKVTSPRLDGLILSQNKNAIKGSDNVVVMYQFETNNSVEEKSITNKCKVIDSGRDVIERSKNDEKRRLEMVLHKELDEIRSEWNAKEKAMKAELVANLREVEEIFSTERRNKLAEQAERHRREIEEALQESQRSHEETLKSIRKDYEEKLRKETDLAEDKLQEKMAALRDEHARVLDDERERLQFENERALSDFSEHLGSELMRQRAKMLDENRINVECLRDEHLSRVAELRHDYRTEIERIRTQHACHLDELRGRLAGERATAARKGNGDHLHDKYRCLKEKYERLKHDVKMSLERRNKRRELSMTTGSETEKSNSHKATQSGDRSKESSDRPAIVIESDCVRPRNNNPVMRCDNETSVSDSQPHKSLTDNNNDEWKNRKESVISPETSTKSGHRSRSGKKHAVAFREPTRSRETLEPLPSTPMTECQDSSDATTADEKPKESINSHGRRRCFTRLKSASTSRLNYSPKRGEGWSSPLESLRQQLRKLDDLEDQFPDLACQPAYSLRYPFGELGGVGVISKGGTPELEFVRHRALVEREGMRRARAALRRRRDALSGRESVDSRESTELEIALHRARALLGEKEIRLRHIENSLKLLSTAQHAPIVSQEATSSASSSSEAEAPGTAGGGAVLRSLRALHADVRDIWRALDARNAASPETSSCLASSHNASPNAMSHPRITLTPDKEILSLQAQDASVSERARGLRAWLQAP